MGEVMKQVLLFGKQTDDKGHGPQLPQPPSQPSIPNSGALPPPGIPGGRMAAEKPCQRLQNDFCWTKQPRVAPPSYEEALSSRVVTSLRLGQSSAATASGSHGGHGGNIRSLSEDRATSHPSPPPPFRGPTAVAIYGLLQGAQGSKRSQISIGNKPPGSSTFVPAESAKLAIDNISRRTLQTPITTQRP